MEYHRSDKVGNNNRASAHYAELIAIHLAMVHIRVPNGLNLGSYPTQLIIMDWIGISMDGLDMDRKTGSNPLRTLHHTGWPTTVGWILLGY